MVAVKAAAFQATGLVHVVGYGASYLWTTVTFRSEEVDRYLG